MRLLVSGLVAIWASGCASAPSGGAVGFGVGDMTGETVGIGQVSSIPGGTFLEVEFTGLPAGNHGLHIHERGVCEMPFASAGAHFNPLGKAHGRDNKAVAHAGDLPNINVPESGLLTASVVVEEVTLEDLAGPPGSALIVHQGLDDGEIDPAGNSGPRIACGVIYAPTD